MDELIPCLLLLAHEGRWVIDCAVGVTGVSMTQTASEPWGNSESTMHYGSRM